VTHREAYRLPATKGGDFEELGPMISAVERELATAGVAQSPGVVLADAGYWSNEHIDSLRERDIVPKRPFRFSDPPDFDRPPPRLCAFARQPHAMRYGTPLLNRTTGAMNVVPYLGRGEGIPSCRQIPRTSPGPISRCRGMKERAFVSGFSQASCGPFRRGIRAQP
jgi:hypothetical protein